MLIIDNILLLLIITNYMKRLRYSPGDFSPLVLLPLHIKSNHHYTIYIIIVFGYSTTS